MSNSVPEGNDLDFEKIYAVYYPKLVRFSKEYVLSQADAENIVQDVFLGLWEQKDILSSLHNINAYLFRLMKNRCIDFLRHKIRVEDKKQSIQDVMLREYELKLYSIEHFDESLLSDEEIERIIANAIDSLPQKCREIFVLSRMEGLKYQEIAERLKLSPSTVNNQITIALKKLKEELKEFLPLFLFLTI